MTYESAKSYNKDVMEKNSTVMISAIILAAGESKRMGRVKQLMTLGDSTILEKVIDNVIGSEVNEVIVVLGYKVDEVKKTIMPKQVKIAINPDYVKGMSTSIVAGIKMADRNTEGLMIVLGDQPFIDSKTIEDLITAFSMGNKGIVLPVFQGRRGNPVIFSTKYKNELLSLKGDIGGRDIVSRNPDDLLELTVDCEGVLTDIDTPESYNIRLEKEKNNSINRKQ
jgi:molybdenum cofactor cytidylyltransferase